VRLERYVKDMLIELHTVHQITDTMVIPAAFAWMGQLAQAAAQAKSAGIKTIPQIAAANEIGAAIEDLQSRRDALVKVIERAESVHDDLEKCGKLLTSEGAEAMGRVREICDMLELRVADDLWPLPKYREMLFPV
jgi:glutamine synthetase